MRRIRRYGGFFCATARVQEKISREYIRGRAEKRHRAGTGREFPADIPVAGRKNLAARVQGMISREYTRGSAEKPRRTGTGEDFARIYPRP